MSRVRTKIRFCCFAVFVAAFGVRFFTPVSAVSFFGKGFPSGGTGNTLWDELYHTCGKHVSFYCVQTKLMDFINTTLDADLRITEGIYFVKSNQPNFGRFVHLETNALGNDSTTTTTTISSRKRSERTLKTSSTTVDDGGDVDNSTDAPDTVDDEQEFVDFVHTVEKIEDDLETTTESHRNGRAGDFTKADNVTAEPAPEKPPTDNLVIRSLNKVTDILYEKTAAYLSSHDLRLDLPQTFFGGSKVVVSPRGFDEDDGGIILKLNFDPAETARDGSIGKYFHKMFKKKLLTSFLALLLIIKLIKIKLMYVLPVIIGVNAAKKLLLKTLLFLFPPLVHLFKLCTYYHAHAAKLHFHHHKIKHHHHHIKVPVPVPVPVPAHKPHGHHHDSHGAHDEYDPAIYDHEHPPPSYEGPLHGSPEYYTRNDMTNAHGDEFASWGLKDFYASTESPGVLSAQAQAFSPYAEQNYNKMLQAAASKPYVSVYKDPFKKTKVSNNVWKTKSSTHASKNSLTVPYDPFYSPILQRIDSIFTQLGFNEEGCRERLICSMYKNPVRFSPHSNLLSTELSRDPSELERPSQSNVAAVRFYRYVEAARHGQSQKDCLALFADCTVRTE